MEVISLAERIAEDLLFPEALATDGAPVLPVELLDALADAGLYGLTGPASAGGMEADFQTVCAVVEALSSGCLTTAFVWAQHLGAVIAAAASENAAIAEWVGPMCRGERRSGLALGGAVPGIPALRAVESSTGWIFSGTSPFVSGWGRIDVIHAAGRTGDNRLVWALVDARESESLSVYRLDLVALNGTNTVRVEMREHPVAAERVTSISPFREGPAPPELLRIHDSFGLGLLRRCCKLLGPTELDDEVSLLRGELDRLDPQTIEAARASVGALALQATGALAAATGSRSLVRSDQAQRLVREALFVLVYALRPGSRAALLAQLGARAKTI